MSAGAHERLSGRIGINPQHVAKDRSQVLSRGGSIVSGAIAAVACGDVENAVIAVCGLNGRIERQVHHVVKRAGLIDAKNFPRVGIR
jgi:hypothetical protein